RTRELAIRGALGARPAELARGTLWTSAVRALLGIGLGALAFALGQAALAARLDQLLLGTRLGWSGIGLFASGLLGVALASALAPSLRAARQEPSRLLRS
ncbi:MAG TPA: FtsX-like permease family protein, partial [Thermoanaerobaculia bacterium]|nr:FtsX-like permease family protein [Thermoanaerobaculia bacterium]